MRALPLSAISLVAVLMTGCGLVGDAQDTAQKTQQCVEAVGIVTETVSKVTSLVDNPAEVEKTLNEGARKLQNLADQAADTTLREAAEGVADKLSGLNVKDANDAVDALQKLATDSLAWADTLTKACA
ncbi:hypothetical protein [Acrocarpospora catenulata]|uniref:hypothetical protein n=1 Tax=Acrocarpospora catenulata TaxID=2836182 RepID=UPI001BD92A95|nr:hypothetical protein [Acrocarpospora catenulata]